jgi:hypothetical protein
VSSSEQACRAIRVAKNESEVIGAVREYLDSLSASEIASLPAEVLAMGLTPAEELIQTAIQALHSCLEGTRERATSGIVGEAALVLTTAARRLAKLAKDTA